VIKLGGSAMEDAGALAATLEDVVFMGHGRPAPDPRPRRRQADRPRDGRRRLNPSQDPRPPLHRPGHARRGRPRPDEQINADIVTKIREAGGRAVGLHSHPLPVLFGQRLTLRATAAR